MIVFEAEDQVGGIAKTEVRDGYRFDLGGHRFFTKSQGGRRPLARGDARGVPQAPAHVAHLLERQVPRLPARRHGRDQEARPGRARPLRPLLPVGRGQAQGPARTTSSSGSPTASASGSTSHFFKTYTEKVWGVPTTELRAEWAAQRIKGLSFFSAAKAAFFGNKGNKIKSLISEFHYPRFGPGQMWETMADEIIAAGGEVRLNAPRREARGPRRPRRRDRGRRRADRAQPRDLLAAAARDGRHGRRRRRPARSRPPPRACATATSSPSRSIIDGEDLFPDNWIYIHEPGVRVGRIQNYRSWSPWMVPDQSKACVGLEYFCFQGDDLWDMTTTRSSSSPRTSSASSASSPARRSSAAS